jgi:DNA-binding IclR family transcriptional regulator
MSSSASRALRILEAVGAAERPLGATEIGRALGLSAGTVFRGLDALERAGYLARFQASPRFVLGKSVAALRQNLLARFPIRDVCAPYLRQLAFASGETCSLTVRLGWHGLRIAAAPGTNEVTSAPPLGAVRPLGEGFAGRAILAFLAVDAPAARQPAPVLAEIRKRGFAVEETAFARGRAAVAFPVRRDGQAIAAIAIEGPVVDLARPAAHDDLPRWREIVYSLERLAHARPALFAGPFDHLDPDDIVLD